RHRRGAGRHRSRRQAAHRTSLRQVRSGRLRSQARPAREHRAANGRGQPRRPAPGDVTRLLRGRYRILEEIGSGGEGRVVRALDKQHDRVVALKIRPVGNGMRRQDILREARILLSLSPHAGLPVVRDDFFDEDEYVVAMDWVEGTDLARLVAERGNPGLPPSSVLRYLAQAAEALTHLHMHDPPVIHGDIKPANLVLSHGGRVVLVDFGVSSSPLAVSKRAGTPGFVAPELAAGDAPTRASDV